MRFELEKSQNIVSRNHYKETAESKNADKNVNSRICDTEVAEGNKIFIGDWAWSHACTILVKNIAVFCLYHENMCEAEFRNNIIFL